MLVKLTTTKPTLLLNANPLRKRFMIQMQPSSVDSNNTGRIHIGKGFQPVATVGHPSQGEVLIQSAVIEEYKRYKEDTLPYKGPIWAVSSKANQTLIVEEEVEERRI